MTSRNEVPNQTYKLGSVIQERNSIAPLQIPSLLQRHLFQNSIVLWTLTNDDLPGTTSLARQLPCTAASESSRCLMRGGPRMVSGRKNTWERFLAC